MTAVPAGQAAAAAEENPCSTAARQQERSSCDQQTARLRQQLTDQCQIDLTLAENVRQVAEAACQAETKKQAAYYREALETLVMLREKGERCEQGSRDLSQEHNRLQAALALVVPERDRLQAALARAAPAPRPGSEALAAFPAEPASLELGLVGLAALLSGFLLGLPGHRRGRERLLSGAVSGLLGLLASLGSIALLPDTRRTELLFALTAALLLVSLRALLRVWLRQRRSAPAAP